ncbi:DUF938 domain-containing protein [Luteithermobacter gelatinilyticus]|uniref:DUF938 domain-containing protein n=1 Tax=Luteithermobacter gelatinilyticus TaxID=2582913 RepID=UPI0011073CCE|nr:DUF938 domain-containing protein [Luteithermobacter gelatinilyticus]|tara:strand:- start:19811 stop:20437 length:627 start_codon:yes stop_codon:yes gene_type:complete
MTRKQTSPAAERNKGPILEVLKDTLPRYGTVLEIASGTGQHAVYFTEHLPPLLWQPTDPDPEARTSIRDWWWEVQLKNILPPLDLDVCKTPWPVEITPPPEPITSIVCINMIHISPWAACVALMEGAGRLLPPEGILYLYGPYRLDGNHTAPSNAEFDRWLKNQNPEWGVRDLGHVRQMAAKNGLEFVRTVAMPANNLSVIFRKNPGL